MTTIHILVLGSDNTFDQPDTRTGQQWKTALCYLGTCPEFVSVAWGRHIETPEKVTMVIEWGRVDLARAFVNEYYPHFAAYLTPIVTEPPVMPFVTDFNTCLIEPKDQACGGITTITKLNYTSKKAGNIRNHVAANFDCYTQVLWSNSGDDGGAAGYKGGMSSWAVNPAGGSTPTLWLFVSWESLESERLCEANYQTDDGRNYKEVMTAEMFERADPGIETYHVAWDQLYLEMMSYWKDSKNTKWPYFIRKDEEQTGTK